MCPVAQRLPSIAHSPRTPLMVVAEVAVTVDESLMNKEFYSPLALGETLNGTDLLVKPLAWLSPT